MAWWQNAATVAGTHTGPFVGHLGLSLQPSELAQPGVMTVTVTNPPPGGGTSPIARFVVQAASGAMIPNITPPQISFGFSYFGFSDTNPLGPSLLFAGVGFDATTLAFWDGGQIPAQVTGPGSIEIRPPTADLSLIARHDLYVTNGTLRSNTVPVLIGRSVSLLQSAADPSGTRLYALQTTTQDQQVSDFVIFDMRTGALLKTVPQALQTPSAIAVSANGAYVYIAGGSSPPTLRRFNTSAGAFDLQWTLTPPPSAAASSIMGLATPSDASQTVMALVNYQYPQGGSEFRIFDGDQQRPLTSSDAGFPYVFGGSLFATQNRILTGSPGCWAWLDYDRSGITGGQGGCHPQPPDTTEDHGLWYVTDGLRVLPGGSNCRHLNSAGPGLVTSPPCQGWPGEIATPPSKV